MQPCVSTPLMYVCRAACRHLRSVDVHISSGAQCTHLSKTWKEAAAVTRRIHGTYLCIASFWHLPQRSAAIDRHRLTSSLDLVGMFRQGNVGDVPSAGPHVGCFWKCWKVKGFIKGLKALDLKGLAQILPWKGRHIKSNLGVFNFLLFSFFPCMSCCITIPSEPSSEKKILLCMLIPHCFKFKSVREKSIQSYRRRTCFINAAAVHFFFFFPPLMLSNLNRPLSLHRYAAARPLGPWGCFVWHLIFSEVWVGIRVQDRCIRRQWRWRLPEACADAPEVIKSFRPTSCTESSSAFLPQERSAGGLW